MTTSQTDGARLSNTLPGGRDQQMIDLRRTLKDLDDLLGENSSEDKWGLTKVMSAARDPGKGNERSAPVGASAAPSARTLMTSNPVAVPASRTALLPRSQDNRSLQLITRFAAGAIILGLEELVKRGEKWEEAAPPEVLAGQAGAPPEPETSGTLLRYWLLGMVTSARRSAWSLAIDAMEAPGSVAGIVSRTTDRVMDAWFFRPVRQPVAAVVNGTLNRLVTLSESWIGEGRQEEQISRWIAENGISEIMDDVIALISENPELAELVRDQLKGQSADIVSSVADTSRRLSAVSDDAAETFVRRLLRRGPRTDTTSITPHEDVRPSGADTPGKGN